jgi:hypothetical protein
MARFFDAKKHGDLQKQATTESDSFSQLKTQRYANVAPRFEKAAALHQSNQVLALTTAILLFKLGLTIAGRSSPSITPRQSAPGASRAAIRQLTAVEEIQYGDQTLGNYSSARCYRIKRFNAPILSHVILPR